MSKTDERTIWAGNSWIDKTLCPICCQPECAQSAAGNTRSKPGSHPSHLEPGRREYRGYSEWAVHPEEAIFILHRGYAIVDGERVHVAFIHNEAFVTQLRVDNSNIAYMLDEKYFQPAAQSQVVA